MRIRVVAWRFPLVSETFVLDHVAGLVARGHRVSVFAERPPAETILHEEFLRQDLPARTFYWPEAPRGRPNQLRWLARALWAHGGLGNLPALLHPRRGPWRNAWTNYQQAVFMDHSDHGADIIHAHFGAVGESIARLKHTGTLRSKFVVSLHGVDVTPQASQGLHPYPNLFRHADRILVTTAFMERQAQAIGCPPAKLMRLPIGIPVAEFPFMERRRRPQEPLRLLTVARLVEKKGVESALRAVARVRAAGENVAYSIVGDGPLRAHLEQVVTSLGIRGIVTFHGALSRKNVIAEFGRCHAFLFPSLTAADGDQEGQGVVVQEAQACGIPVIATRHGGVPEGCLEGRSALLVPEGDDAALADAVLALARREAEWPAMGLAGRRLVESKYSLSGHLDAMESLYRSLGATA